MAYSYVVYTGNGSTTQYDIPFNYIRKEHIKVYVNYVDTAYTYVNATTVLLAAAPASPLRVEVRRVTPLANVLVDYTDGSTLVAADLDTSSLQSLYNEQELDDSLKQTVSIDPATGLPTAGGQRITNVANPVNAQDAATKTYVDTADALKVSKAGDSMTGALAMGTNKITGLGTPTTGTDAATKTYVDNNALRINGSNTMAADLNMGGYKVINAIAPTTDTGLATKQYVDLRSGISGPPGYTSWAYTAAGGETALGSTGLSGGALEYQVGKETVFLNGALLLRGDDYTADNGTSIALAIALAQGDHVSVRSVNYLPDDPGASYTYMRWRKTAAGGETSVGPAGGITTSGYTSTLNYAINREQVYINGALLARGNDYAASTTSTITGLAALTVGDIIEVHSINTP